ncbi:MAG: hypothetical protein KJ583_06010 [Nanoarchaeota archaeon]|nr:hypothetical protein [Nanoarchaeota archaeon]MBU1270256.1 hypothetical protein [Nanoarchaeota archaeon]MBU1604840.1 hypothetical protein [Nanoarchaeota archaeon]MBU2442490.1 hypothetical protein [Nanoarchaeota archaeon]
MNRGVLKIKSSNTKGQASFEFLATYGWVFMVILIMFGALTYFDVLNPEKYIREDCIFGTNIMCEDWSIKKVTQNTFDMNLKLRNDLEKPIAPVNVSLYDRDLKLINDCQFGFYCPYDGTAKNWTADSSGVFSNVSIDPKWGNGKSCRLEAIGCTKSLISNTKETIRVSFSFMRIGGSIPHTINSKVFTEVTS